MSSVVPTATSDASGSTPLTAIEGVVVSALDPADSGLQGPLWLAYTYGLRGFDPQQQHIVAIYTRDASGWRQLARTEMANPDYVSDGTVTQVKVAPGRLWVESQSGVGAHGSCYDLLSFDGTDLRSEVSFCASMPGAGELRDLNEDGTPDVVLDRSEPYIFCYACNVRRMEFGVLRWDGSAMREVNLEALPSSAPTQARAFTDLALKQVSGGLWKDAAANISQALVHDPSNPTLVWNHALINLTAQARASHINEGSYPMLAAVFYGDYPAAVELMRAYKPGDIFTLQTPLIKGTPAEDWAKELGTALDENATLALSVQSDLASAYFMRGWGRYLVDPTDPAVLPNVERAAMLAPDDPLFAESAAHLRQP
jgi:hypothetical protein